MRVKKVPDYIPSTIALEEILDLEGFIGLIAPEQPEDPNEIVNTELFNLLIPGNERICVVLRADGLSYGSISEIMGLSEGQVKNIIYNIRKRILSESVKES